MSFILGDKFDANLIVRQKPDILLGSPDPSDKWHENVIFLTPKKKLNANQKLKFYSEVQTHQTNVIKMSCRCGIWDLYEICIFFVGLLQSLLWLALETWGSNHLRVWREAGRNPTFWPPNHRCQEGGFQGHSMCYQKHLIWKRTDICLTSLIPKHVFVS